MCVAGDGRLTLGTRRTVLEGVPSGNCTRSTVAPIRGLPETDSTGHAH